MLRVIRTAASSKPDLEFEYDAGGQRIVKKVIRKDGTVTSTYYLRDADGNVMSVYSYGSTDNLPVLTEQYLYGSSRIGVYSPTAGVLSKTRNAGYRSYELSDHLGNVRATLSDYRRLASHATVNSATDYYPFGMVARTYTSSNQYRYGYNGKEHEDDINGTGGDYDFGARIYDSRIARFLSVDPMTNKLPGWSPYVFCYNNSIMVLDPTGQVPYPITIRAFAPFDDFGFGYHGDGANRGYSNVPSSKNGTGPTARLHQLINFDTDLNTIPT